MAKRITKNRRLFEKARQYLVGGVDSPVRSFAYVGGDPILIKSGRGSKVYDYDGKEYIDYVLSYGAGILGHADKTVVKDLKHASGLGFSFGTTNENEVELSRLIAEAIPFVDKIRFVNSGTEAVMGAVRLGRAYTGRDKILKFENSYHGHADYLLTKAGSGLATFGMPSSAGVPENFIKDTIVLPQQDTEAAEDAFRKFGRRISAVIVEPVAGNYGVWAPDHSHLKKIRALTRQYGALLIFDEVITGFRFDCGSFAEKIGVIPDLVCLGKIIGGGLPIGAYGGAEDIMKHLAPEGNTYQASTFAGNPVVMQAGVSTLKILKSLKPDYPRLGNLARYLAAGIRAEAVLRGIELNVTQYGGMFSIKFKRKSEFRRFYRGLLKRGIYFAPSEFESNFISFAHTKGDIVKTLDAVRAALEKI